MEIPQRDVLSWQSLDGGEAASWLEEWWTCCRMGGFSSRVENWNCWNTSWWPWMSSWTEGWPCWWQAKWTHSGGVIWRWACHFRQRHMEDLPPKLQLEASLMFLLGNLPVLRSSRRAALKHVKPSLLNSMLCFREIKQGKSFLKKKLRWKLYQSVTSLGWLRSSETNKLSSWGYSNKVHKHQPVHSKC